MKDFWRKFFPGKDLDAGRMLALPGTLTGALPGTAPGTLPGAVPGTLRGAYLDMLPGELPKESESTYPCCDGQVHIAYRGLSDDRLYCSQNRKWTEVKFFRPNGLRVFCAGCRRRLV